MHFSAAIRGRGGNPGDGWVCWWTRSGKMAKEKRVTDVNISLVFCSFQLAILCLHSDYIFRKKTTTAPFDLADHISLPSFEGRKKLSVKQSWFWVGRFANVVVQMTGGSPGSAPLGWPLISALKLLKRHHQPPVLLYFSGFPGWLAWFLVHSECLSE